MAIPLISGGELHLVASDYYEPELILNTIATEQITVLNCAPVFILSLKPHQPRVIKVCAHCDACSLVVKQFPLQELNHGPLRRSAKPRLPTCMARLSARMSRVSIACMTTIATSETSVPIGKPIWNSQVYLVDQNLKQVPIGVTGEICLAGDGVGKGYLTDPFLTAEKFLKNPFAKSPDEYFYRTEISDAIYPMEILNSMDALTIR